MKTTSVFVTAVTLLSVGLFSHSNESVAKDLVIDSLVPGSPMNVLHTRLATLTKKYTSHKMQVSMGSPPPKSAVDAAKGSVDFFLYSPLINTFMKNQKAMYAKLKSAKELHSKLRGIVAHNGGIYAFITYADSGIKTIKDFKGKKLYMGPFGGAASRMGVGIIKSVTGYTQKDYQQSRLGISAGGQAFQDGQVDVWMIPNPHPTPVVEQFALTRKIRVIGVPEDKWSTPGLQRLLKLPGRGRGTIPAGVYGKNQVNKNKVDSISVFVGVASSTNLDAKTAYDITKTMWEHMDEIYEAGPYMQKMINKETAFFQMDIPLHAGAYKYYKEAGFNVPAALIPPEAK